MRYLSICLVIMLFSLAACAETSQIPPDNASQLDSTNATGIAVATPNGTEHIQVAEPKYEIATYTNQTCEQDEDCGVPPEYALLSHCPYQGRCLNSSCAVVCPHGFEQQRQSYDDLETIGAKECSERGGRAVNLVGDADCEDTEMALGKIIEFISPSLCCAPKNIDYLGHDRAVEMGQKICEKHGTLETIGTYDAQEKMWFFDILNETAECAPICEVSEKLRKASIAYECLGPIQKDEKKYATKDVELCKTTEIFCDIGQQDFFDTQGCGCEMEPLKVKHFCEEDSRSGTCETAATEDVCGWLPQGLTCQDPPCVISYNNACEACLNAEIVYWTQGTCPERR